MNPDDMYQGDKVVCESCDKDDKKLTFKEVDSRKGKCRNGHVIFLPLEHDHLSR